MRTEHIMELLDDVTNAGFEYVDLVAPIQFDVPVRYLREDPWERVRRVHEAAPNTKFRSMVRSRNLASFDFLPDDRRIAVCRELTKMYEEVRRGTLDELARWAADGVKGEITVVIAGAVAGILVLGPIEVRGDAVGGGGRRGGGRSRGRGRRRRSRTRTDTSIGVPAKPNSSRSSVILARISR